MGNLKAVLDTVTDLLDLAGLALLAAGLGFAAGYWIGWAGIGVSGLTLIGGSRLIDWFALPADAPKWFRRLVRRGP